MKKTIKRKRYLLQLLVTSLLLLLIPSALFFGLFNRSYRDISTYNADYYNRITRLFSGTVVNTISKMKDHAVTFSINSQVGDYEDNIFHSGTEKMQTNHYYYWEAAKLLNEYRTQGGYSSMGIYYYDADFILFNGVKYTKSRFASIAMGVDPQSSSHQKVTAFFDEGRFLPSEVLFSPVHSENETEHSLLIGICVKMGRHSESALLFYQFQLKDLEFFAHSVQTRPWETYLILDKTTGDCLFGFGGKQGSSRYDMAQLADTATVGETSGHQELFLVEADRFNLAFVVDVSENPEQNIVFQLYENLRIFLAVIPLILIVLCYLAVYLNYQPVRRLVRTITDDSTVTDEFNTVLGIWEAQNRQLDEQQMVILELLMNRLIYGLPIPEEHIKKVRLHSRRNVFCVFLIDGYVLDTEEMAVVSRAADEFDTILYMSDMPDEKNTVIIAFMKTDRANDISGWMSHWCMNHIQIEYAFFTGTVVYHINDIDKSLAHCKGQQTQLREAKRLQSEHRDSREQRELILQFLNENIQNPDLSQTMIADRFHISVYSLSRMFKTQFGSSFAEYVNGKRMEMARELLETTDLTNSEIAAKIGISDANYMGKVFKRSYGMSPSEFRKSL